ncbi:MAG: zf-HC2 domain-containing protein [Clostridium butyricum]|nr:zf-HC2 domain-containing protein [Clostridium butyricum]
MKELECYVIHDLLPSYVEFFTSKDTNKLVEEHLKSCDECRRLCNSYSTELQIPLEQPNTNNKKTINGMRFKFLWYLFWPMFYGATLQFREEGSLEFMVIALTITVFSLISAPVLEYDFDTDDSKKTFYKREEKNINSEKGSFFTQAFFWVIPIIIPILFKITPLVISYFNS